jgi:hypothetical protein
MSTPRREWKSDADFKPWRSDQRLAAIFFLAAIGCAIAALALPFGTWTLFLGGGAAVAALSGRYAMKLAAHRAFGKTFEAESIASLLPLLPVEWIVRPGTRLPGLGDVDLWITLEDGRHVIVEIKSFRRWMSRFFGFRHGEREAKALEQASRIAERLNASAGIVWLPQGKPTFWQWLFAPRSGDVRVVFGGPRTLVQAIRRA